MAVPFDYERRARASREADKRFHDAYRYWSYPYKTERTLGGEEYLRALSEWHQTVAEAYPPEFWDDYALLRAHNPSAVESALLFLEADPIFFRSGYVKTNLLRSLGQVALSEEQRNRLQEAVLNVVRSRYGREFRDYCRLARRIDSPGFRAAIEALTADRDAHVRRRAGWMLYYVQHGAYEQATR